MVLQYLDWGAANGRPHSHSVDAQAGDAHGLSESRQVLTSGSTVNRQTNGVHFIITALTKTRRSGPPLEAFYPALPENLCLCLVEECVVRMASLRSESSGQTLYLLP